MNKLCLILVSILLFSACPVQAIAKDKQYLLSKETYDLLAVARDEMEAEKYQSVVHKLRKHLDKGDIKPYDMAVVKQTLGYAYNAMGDYKLSIESFVNAVTTNALPDNVAHELNYIIAQLLIHSEKYTEGLDYLNRWFEKETDPSPEAHLLIASAYYQTNQFRKLIPHAKSALEKSASPQQSWYELLLAGYYETKMFRKAASLLETMINKYPDNNNYWLQLAAVYQENKQERKGLAISELAYEKGILNSNNIIQLAQTYLYLQMPLKAATILDTELKNGKIESSKLNIELLLNSWLLAHEVEQAALLLEHFAPKFNDVSLYYKLGHIYVELEDWSNAKNSLESVASNNQFKSQHDLQASTWLLLGISSYHMNDLRRSKEALNRALGFKETKDHAAWWLEHIAEISSKEPDSSA